MIRFDNIDGIDLALFTFNEITIGVGGDTRLHALCGMMILANTLFNEALIAFCNEPSASTKDGAGIRSWFLREIQSIQRGGPADDIDTGKNGN